MKELMEMLAKKSAEGSMDEGMDRNDILAKIDVLKELLEMADEKTGADVSEGMKKLTVMAPDKEGLMEGMETAEDMVEGDELPMPEDEESMSEDDEDEEEEEGY